ncbi:MAG: type VI secretion protein IcmF/TssM N-terminal domain-containing protein [Methylococcales bacterium]|nr:type VI secretion protein IcmF/TssM N-terminal domain-containing protein [Methylococcales bacterium]
MGFLDLLNKHRSRRPISGAIIAVSIADLLQQNKAQQQALAQSIRKRIQELHEHFNIRFPIMYRLPNAACEPGSWNTLMIWIGINALKSGYSGIHGA